MVEADASGVEPFVIDARSLQGLEELDLGRSPASASRME